MIRSTSIQIHETAGDTSSTSSRLRHNAHGPISALCVAAALACFAAVTPAQTEEPEGLLTGASLDPPPSEATGRSADEVARELANPNNSLASLTFKNQFRWYDGDLPDADDQFNFTVLFQPVFPFTMPETSNGGKANLFVRPAIPIIFDQPVPSFGAGGFDFDGESGIGDIGFDIGYGVTEPNGLLWAFGMVGTLPTATSSVLSGKQLRLGPEALFAKFEKWGVYGIFPTHQWDVTGWGGQSFSTTSIQPILKFLPGGGWSVGSTPIIFYNWDSEEWTLPLNLTVSKTLQMGKTPVKLELEANYYVETPDAFGPEWMIGINITPVVPNFIDKWIRR